MPSADAARPDSFTLDAMLARREAAEEALDDTERATLMADFSAYAEAFVAHVPDDPAEAFESVLLARYLTFLPDLEAEVAGPIREPLETALSDLSAGAASAGTVEALWRAMTQARQAKSAGHWVEVEKDLPIITVVGNVIEWARGALMA